MTLLEILSQQVVGKRIVSGSSREAIGATILYVKLHPSEPIFEVGVRFPDGRTDFVDILDDWDIVVE